MSYLYFKITTNVTLFCAMYFTPSSCSHGLILPDEMVIRSFCSFVCAFDFSAQLQRRLGFPNQFKTNTETAKEMLTFGNISHKFQCISPWHLLKTFSNYSDNYLSFIVFHGWSMIWVFLSPVSKLVYGSGQEIRHHLSHNANNLKNSTLTDVKLGRSLKGLSKRIFVIDDGSEFLLRNKTDWKTNCLKTGGVMFSSVKACICVTFISKKPDCSII